MKRDRDEEIKMRRGMREERGRERTDITNSKQDPAGINLDLFSSTRVGCVST